VFVIISLGEYTTAYKDHKRGEKRLSDGSKRLYYYCAHAKEEMCKYNRVLTLFSNGTKTEVILNEHSCKALHILKLKPSKEVDEELSQKLSMGQSVSKVVSK
jgi:hypothetical protein